MTGKEKSIMDWQCCFFLVFHSFITLFSLNVRDLRRVGGVLLRLDLQMFLSSPIKMISWAEVFFLSFVHIGTLGISVDTSLHVISAQAGF